MRFGAEELIAVCEKPGNIYIYGAGKNAGYLFQFLKRKGIRVNGFIVSDRNGNPEDYFGCPVAAVDRFTEDPEDVILVPVPGGYRAYKEIYDCLIEHRKRNAYFLPTELLKFIKSDALLQQNKSIFNNGACHIGEDVPVEAEHHILVMKGPNGKEYHWRFRKEMVKEQSIRSFASMFPQGAVIEEFEKQYGEYHVFRSQDMVEEEKNGRQKTCGIYMARSHVDKASLQDRLPDWIVPVQAGAALTDREICEIKDNTGENISEKNGNYSECTVIYWMWKNAPRTDYIGLCHYRRRFDMEPGETERLAASCLDVLVTAPTFVNETIGAFFSTLTPESDLRVMLEVIERLYPEYASSAEEFLASRFYPPCNLFVMKYEIFQEYAEFAFSVTFEIERFYDKLGFYRKDRYMGYIMECLLGIFLMKNKNRLKIGYADMRFFS